MYTKAIGNIGEYYKHIGYKNNAVKFYQLMQNLEQLITPKY